MAKPPLATSGLNQLLGTATRYYYDPYYHPYYYQPYYGPSVSFSFGF